MRFLTGLASTGMESSGKATKFATSVGLKLLSTVAVRPSSAPFVRAFNRELERVRAEDALVAYNFKKPALEHYNLYTLFVS